jgi:hypothetical protein
VLPPPVPGEARENLVKAAATSSLQASAPSSHIVVMLPLVSWLFFKAQAINIFCPARIHFFLDFFFTGGNPRKQ